MSPEAWNKLLLPDASFPYPLAVKGNGAYIIDEDGKEYLDGSSGAYVSNIGHAVPEIAEAIYQQCLNLEFAHRTQFMTRPVLEMAEILAGIAPGDLTVAYLTTSGSESNETAIKIARRYHLTSGNPEKHVMLSRWLSYHGNSLGAQSLSGIARLRDEDYPLLHDWPRVDPCYCYRCPYDRTHPECDLRCAYSLEEEILRIGPKYVAAFFMEPVVGSSCPGSEPPPGYVEIIRDICDRYQVLLVADEVITSFGRTGKYFGAGYWGVMPDIITVGKGLSCAYSPLGATLISERVSRVLRQGSPQFGTGHTLNFSPLSVAAGVAVQRYIERNGLVERAAGLSGSLFESLREALGDFPVVGDIRGKGLLAGIELMKDRDSKEPFPPETGVAKKVGAAALEEGLIVYASRNRHQGRFLDFLSVAPPLIVTEDQIGELTGNLARAIGRVLSQVY